MDRKDDELLLDGLMKEMDKDGDGFLSLVEVQTVAQDEDLEEEHKKLMEKAFHTADADKDDKLSAAEFPVAFKEYETEFPVAFKEYESFPEAEGEDGENSQD